MSRIDREAREEEAPLSEPPRDGLEDNPYALTRGDRDHAGQYRARGRAGPSASAG